jgi:hypothetical protein
MFADPLPAIGLIVFWAIVMLIAIRHPADWYPDWRPEFMKRGTPVVPIRRNVLITIGMVGIITGFVMLAVSFMGST